MFSVCVVRWHWLIVFPLLFAICSPLLAQWETETAPVSLSGIALKDDFNAVLSKKGAPHFVGPALPSVQALASVFDPAAASKNARAASTPAARSTTAPTTGGSPWSRGVGGPWAQGGAPSGRPMGQAGPPTGRPNIQMPPGNLAGGGGAARPATGGTTRGGATGEDPLLSLMNKYVVWLYVGSSMTGVPKPSDGYATYIIFDKKTGTVQSVVTWCFDMSKPVSIKTPLGIGIGSPRALLWAKYGYPKKNSSLGGNYVFSYPDEKVAFSVDPGSYKVVGISIGTNAYTAVVNKAMFADKTVKSTPGAKRNSPASPSGRPSLGGGSFVLPTYGPWARLGQNSQSGVLPGPPGMQVAPR